MSWSEEACRAHRVIVCGSRKWRDREAIADRLFDLPPSIIVHGNAAGADRIAAQEAVKLGHLVESHPADWDRWGKRAGPIRNVEMADLGAALCIAFWDGQSTGTAHMVGVAQGDGIPVEVIHMCREDTHDRHAGLGDDDTVTADTATLAQLKRAVRKYLRAKYDDSYSPTKDWHKRHDEGNAEAKMAELVGWKYK